MFRMGIVFCAVEAVMPAQEFRFSIGNPVAAPDFRSKTAAFVFRLEGCADPAASKVGGTVEGVVKETRRSAELKLTGVAGPGVYAVYKTWPAEGDWVVRLNGTCGAANAGAIVPVGPNGFIRELSKFFVRPATDLEIGEALSSLGRRANNGGGK